MPCAAPCSRLPCNQRCSKNLSCGHQCPGICGEVCAEGYCHQCSSKLDSRVEFLEMKSYGEININETPIVVLGCGHFFTAESLDGLMGMSEVYEVNRYGEFTGLKDVSAALAGPIPCCPDCKCPVRQFATQRYNRVINRAVIDEMSKRFLTTGRHGLRELERQILEVEEWLDTTRHNFLQPILQAQKHLASSLTAAKNSEIARTLKDRYAKSNDLESAIKTFCKNVADKHQPAQKLHEATVRAARRAVATTTALDVLLANLATTDSVPTLGGDRRITMGGKMVQIKAEFVILHDKFLIAQELKSKSIRNSIKIPSGGPGLLAIPFFQGSKSFIDECNNENLPKLAVEVSLFYASIARLFESFCTLTDTEHGQAETHVQIAKQLLENAREACKQPFQNAEKLLIAVEDSIRLMKKHWYDKVTVEEIQAIKAAMVSGFNGIATHSGHWYNCENGHPVRYLEHIIFGSC